MQGSLKAYLDHNATTTIRPSVIEAMNCALMTGGNSSSVHSSGRDARQMIEEARENVASLVGSETSKVIFTSGVTESNNLAIRGVKGRKVITSAIEHVSVLSSASDILSIPVDKNGVVIVELVEKALRNNFDSSFVSVMLANNETGVIQPVKEIAKIAHEYGAIVHCDAVQALGKVECNIMELEVDLLSISGHKIGGPQGVGALVSRGDVGLTSINKGGGQEQGLRGGTENFPGIVGFGAAALVAKNDLSRFSQYAILRDELESKVQRVEPVQIFGVSADRLPNTTCFTMPGVSSETQVMSFDLSGFAISAGAACSSGKVEVSHVLTAMGVSRSDAEMAIRVSLGWDTEEYHVNDFFNTWMSLFEFVGETNLKQNAVTG